MTPFVAGRAFVTERVVRFADCDPAGIVYFPRCFDLLNGVVEDWWAAMGFPWRITIMERRVGLPTASLTATFAAPSFLGERLTFRLSVARIGRSSAELRHTVGAGDSLRFRAVQSVVCTALETHAAQPWPDDLRTAMAVYLDPSVGDDPCT